jgi:PAS domain-containing protein
MCPDCRDFMKKNTRGRSLEEFLDELPVPVLALKDDAVILTINKEAASILGKSVESVRGLRGGDIIECPHSRLAGGCGNTVHCTGCAIRRTVEYTYVTGKPVVEIPALQDVNQGGKLKKVEFRISTLKRGDVVLLRVDGTGEP